VLVGGRLVDVGGIDVGVGGIDVDVGGIDVDVGGIGVAAGLHATNATINTSRNNWVNFDEWHIKLLS